MISFIVPVLNEEAIVGMALESLLHQTGDYEVVVVDGGSHDRTCETVRSFPVRLVPRPLSASPGIGSQINLGAAQARGEILVFLHVDVQLPPGGTTAIEAALADPQVIGGGFVPKFYGAVPDSERLLLVLVERFWQTRARLSRWFAGDTAPFIRSEVFWSSGGYPTTGFASDLDFARKLKRLGRLAVIREPARVHCRRHVMNGVFRTLLVSSSVEVMFHLGASRPFLRDWYHGWLPREREAAN